MRIIATLATERAIFLSAQQTALGHALADRNLRANLLAAIEHSAEVDPEAPPALRLFSPLLFTQGPINQATRSSLAWRLRKTMAPRRRTLFLASVCTARSATPRLAWTPSKEHERSSTTPTIRWMKLVLDAEIRLFEASGRPNGPWAVSDALNRLKRMPPAHEAKLHSAIGNVYYNLGRTDDALEAFESAGRGFTQLDMPFHAARALGNAGMIHLAQQRFQEAEEHFTICLKQYAQAHHIEDLARTHLYLGALALDRERLDDAELHTERLLKQRRSSRRPRPL